MEHKDGILIDWLSFTSKTMLPEEVMELIGITSDWDLIDRGVHGYGARYYHDFISIHFGGSQDNVWCEFTGRGCRAFESDSTHGSYKVIFDRILKDPKNMKVTRLDIAFDDYSGLLDIDRLAVDTHPHQYEPEKRRWKSKLNFTDVRISSNGTTCMIGSQKSLVLIRIYDKRAEQIANVRGAENKEKIAESIPHWVRCELQLRDERALEFVKYLNGKDTVTPITGPLDIGHVFRGVLEEYLDYGYSVAARGNPKQMVWHRFKYWQKFLQSVEPLSLYRKPGKEYDLSQLIHSVQYHNGNQNAACLEILGVQGFLNLIDSRPTQQNKKYTKLIEKHGRYTDKLDTDMVVEFLNNAEKLPEEDRHPLFKRFASPSWVIWNGERYLMCRHCNEVLPEKAFTGVTMHFNFATCYKCASKRLFKVSP